MVNKKNDTLIFIAAFCYDKKTGTIRNTGLPVYEQLKFLLFNLSFFNKLGGTAYYWPYSI